MIRRFIALGVVLVVVGAAYLVWVWPRDARPAIGDTGHAVSRDGSEVTYYARGPAGGPVLVLLASLGRSVSDFNELVEGLNEAGYRTIAVQSRGIGAHPVSYREPYTLYSLGEDIDAALHAAGIADSQPVSVIGHAFGNRAARAFASRTAHPIAHLVLLAAGGAQDLDAMPKARDALRRSFAWWLPPATRKAAVRYAFFADKSAIPDYWIDGWYMRAARGQSAAVKATAERSWREGDGKSPILIVQARDDRVAPADKAAALLKAEMPSRVTVVYLPDAGHALLPEHPSAIRDAVAGFLSRPAATTGEGAAPAKP